MNWKRIVNVIGAVCILGAFAVGFYPVSEECKDLGCRTEVDSEGKYTIMYSEKPLLVTLVDKVLKTDLPLKYRVYQREYRVDNEVNGD